MPIETNNLVLYKSERLTDAPDGGGKYSGQVVTDGESNNLFQMYLNWTEQWAVSHCVKSLPL